VEPPAQKPGNLIFLPSGPVTSRYNSTSARGDSFLDSNELSSTQFLGISAIVPSFGEPGNNWFVI
jgi:hypothetical protein